jgi:hypothetical protein
MKDTFKNCPFCGSGPEIEPDEDRPLVKCSSGSCTASELWFTPEDWNNRPLEALAEQSAREWNQCAKNWKFDCEQNVAYGLHMKAIAEKAEAERDALKCCGNCANWDSFSENCKIIRKIRDRTSTCQEWEKESYLVTDRILAATEEE